MKTLRDYDEACRDRAQEVRALQEQINELQSRRITYDFGTAEGRSVYMDLLDQESVLDGKLTALQRAYQKACAARDQHRDFLIAEQLYTCSATRQEILAQEIELAAKG